MLIKEYSWKNITWVVSYKTHLKSKAYSGMLSDSYCFRYQLHGRKEAWWQFKQKWDIQAPKETRRVSSQDFLRFENLFSLQEYNKVSKVKIKCFPPVLWNMSWTNSVQKLCIKPALSNCFCEKMYLFEFEDMRYNIRK